MFRYGCFLQNTSPPPHTHTIHCVPSPPWYSNSTPERTPSAPSSPNRLPPWVHKPVAMPAAQYKKPLYPLTDWSYDISGLSFEQQSCCPHWSSLLAATFLTLKSTPMGLLSPARRGQRGVVNLMTDPYCPNPNVNSLPPFYLHSRQHDQLDH